MDTMNATATPSHTGKFASVLVLAAVAVLVLVLSVILIGSDDSDAGTSGSCGDDLNWTYNETTGELTISGTGFMTNYTGAPSEVRWDGNEIKSVDMSGMIGTTTIGAHAFDGCSSLTNVVIPNSTTTLGDYAFKDCSSLTSLTIGSNLGPFDFGKVLSGCTSLANISISVMGSGTFSAPGGVLYSNGTVQLYYYPCAREGSDYTIPNSVTSVAEGAFDTTPVNLKNLTLGTGIAADIGFLSDCTFLRTIDVVPGNPNYSSLGGVLFDLGQTQILRYPASGPSAYIIPAAVTDIGANAFSNCTNLKHLTFNTGLTTVAANAFTGATLYEADTVTPIAVTADNLKGNEFYAVGGKLSKLTRVFAESAGNFTATSGAGGLAVDAVNVAYLKESVADGSTMIITTPEGFTASFDKAAILNLSDGAGTFSFVKLDNSALDEATKALVGSDPIYSITFGGNASFGTGKVTYTVGYTLPEGRSADELKVHYVNAGAFAEEMSFNYAAGVISFTSSHLSMYSIQLQAPAPPTVLYTVELILNGGESSSVSTDNGWTFNGTSWTKSFADGSSLAIDDPSRDGYSFDGWSPALPSTVPADGSYEADFSKNPTVIARFTWLWALAGVAVTFAIAYLVYYIIDNGRKKSS